MKTFKYKDAATLAEAVALLDSGNAAVLAGGTDLLNVLKQGALPEPPELLVNIKNIAGCSHIDEAGGTLTIGALTKIADIAASAVVKTNAPALAQAAATVSAPTLRTMGTLGGNICQEVQCWYFRRSHMTGTWFDCLRKGGSTCYALDGDSRHHSIFGRARVSSTPCAARCPAHTDIPAYVARVREGDLDGAARILLRHNPFPAVTGRVCPHFCESGCNRVCVDDEPLSVRSIERYVGDYILENKERFVQAATRDTRKKAAVIGSGPAGLSAAYFLRQFGHTVTVFETQPVLGGTMTLAIPGYRLPGRILEQEVEFVRASGIEIRTGVAVGETVTIPRLMAQGYQAVFVAIGAQAGRKPLVPGADLAGVVTGLDFLRDLKAGRHVGLGRRVAVVGGGSVAFDCARSAIRQGARDVHLVCLESRETMPADSAEISEGEAEGVIVHPSVTVNRVVGGRGRVTGVEVARVLSMRFAEDGRLELQAEPDSTREFPADTVIFAIGQVPDLGVLTGIEGLTLKGSNTIQVDEQTLSTGVEGVFAGGDVSVGAGSVIEAIACGRRAAASIDRYLGGSGELPDTESQHKPALLSSTASGEPPVRIVPPQLAVAERVESMEAEVVGSCDWTAIEAEAKRCLNCGCLAVSPSDLAPVLVALDARVKTTKRTLAAADFFAVEGRRTTVLAKDEIVTEIEIPIARADTGQAFVKFAQRPAIDFACVSAAAFIAYSGGRVSEARIMLGAVAPVPYRAGRAAALLEGRTITEESAAEAAAAIAEEALPLEGNRYKLAIAQALVKRVVLAARPDG